MVTNRSSWWILLIVATALQNTETTEIIKAHVGDSVALPCRVDTSQCGDLHSVKWYRDTSRIYVFSQVGGIHRAEGDTSKRMNVSYTQNSTQALLKISAVEIPDEASYKCEITYLEVRENCDVVQIIKLMTLVTPESPQIRGSDGKPLGNATILGPYNEGTDVELVCEATNGKPVPKVSWYNGSHEMKASYSSDVDSDGTGTGRSIVHIKLTRGDLGAQYQCKVESDALEEPAVSWLTADVNVRPTHMEMSGVKSHVVQESNVMLTCDIFGARPAAEVKWYNNSLLITDRIIDTAAEHERDGTWSTKSTFVFQATRWENGQTFHCTADNSVIRDYGEPALHKQIPIEVYYPPVIRVFPTNITTNESTDILLGCSYVANPMKLDGVVWAKNGKNLTLSPEKYRGGTTENVPLVIKNVSREDLGEYTCICKNGVASQESEESIFVNVHYPPDVEVNMDPPTPVKAKDRGNVTLVCGVTAGNPSTLFKVKWYLGGELLKELPECNYTSYDVDGNGEGYGGPLCNVDPSILSLEEVEENFAGNYTCMGKNIAGWGPESEPKELIVYYPPSPAKLDYTPSKIIKTASVTLDCSVKHPGRPDNVTYMWYRGVHLVPDVTTPNWTIYPVTLETKTNFTCVAVNKGGSSVPDTKAIEVLAPPSFIRKLPPYQGVLMSSKNVSLVCRVECSPICSIMWHKDESALDVNNRFYYVTTAILPPDTRTNDFESIESTLVFNMSAWPGEQLDRTAPNSNYSCQSSTNGIGPGVSSNTEIAVDYPPENLTVSKRVVSVVENYQPEKISCSGKGHPKLNFVWRKNGTHNVLSNTNELQLTSMKRSDAGAYICEATNKHGSEITAVNLDVLYSPQCDIIQTDYNGSPALRCTGIGNPLELSFTWKVKNANETLIDNFSTRQHVANQGLLLLDTSVDTVRTYQCFANNTVGISDPCEIDIAAHQEQSSQIGVPGAETWWRLDNEYLLILIAIVIGIIVCVVIVCIIIILVCRRKRANSKYNSPLELEEREKPDGYSPDTSGQSKWPLKPGVLLHVNKMHNLNMENLSDAGFKTASLPRLKRRIKYKRNKNKIYARLERLKDLLGLRDQESLPIGVYHGSNGVVTFKKFNKPSSLEHPQPVTVSRKRKKPGQAPNQSSTGDKGGLGGVPPVDGTTDPPIDLDRTFYENLPFHGMQNPPNKPISVITPFMQGKAPIESPSKSSITPFHNIALDSYNIKRVQRIQSFHGFQNSMTSNYQSQNIANSRINNVQPFQRQNNQFPPFNRFVPSIFWNLPQRFNEINGNNTVAAIRPRNENFNAFNRVQSYGNLAPNSSNVQKWGFDATLAANPFSVPSKKVAEDEQKDIRRTASGINIALENSNANVPNTTVQKETLKSQAKPPRRITLGDKRFSSLELKKHKCYSLTFYSMRCKKHAKKRPVIYAISKKCNHFESNQSENKSDVATEVVKVDKDIETYEHLTDSIQILEQQDSANSIEEALNLVPQPAPRCKKHKKTSNIYANLSNNLNLNRDETHDSNNVETALDSSNNSSGSSPAEISVTKAIVHEPCNGSTNQSSSPSASIPSNCSASPKIVSLDPKSDPQTSPEELLPTKNSPTVKVSPNVKQPSPVGALNMQLHAKIKSPSKKEPTVPMMPLLDTENKLKDSLTQENAFYTLTTPHFKQLTAPNYTQQYSATIPHQKHIKLIPRALFQDQQLSKSKSFSTRTKQKKHFQIPLQKCHSFKFQTAESYFQPIKNIHEENLMRNGYASDVGPNYPDRQRDHIRPRRKEKEKHKSRGPLVLRRPGDYQENIHFQENMQNAVHLQYPQPLYCGRTGRPNGVVYADLDMPKSNTAVSKHSNQDECSSLKKSQKVKTKTEYATLRFNDIGKEIDV